MIVVLFACLAGLTYLVTRYLRTSVTVAPAVVVGLITSFLFVADFLGALKQMASLLIGLGAVGSLGLAVCAWRELLKRGFSVMKDREVPLWLLVIALFLALFLTNKNQLLHNWDEFSHWGSVIKAIFLADTFHFKENPLYFQDYPPGTGLFAYFVLSILGYSEGGAYFSYGLILLAHCIPLYGLAQRSGPAYLLGSAAASLVLVKVLGHGWSSVLIDHILSVVFAGIVAAYLVARQERTAFWPIAALLVTLVLAKHAGSSMALVAFAVIVVDSFIIFFAGREKWEKTGPAAVRAGIGNAFALAMLLVPAWVLARMWNQYVINSDLARGYGRFGVWELIQRFQSCCQSERDLTILSRYLDSWLGLRGLEPLVNVHAQGVLSSYLASRGGHLFQIGGYSPLLLTLAITAVSLFAVWQSKTRLERFRQVAALSMLGLASLAFAGVQLLFYLYALSEYEALGIASFKRFQDTYYLAWALSALAFLGVTAPWGIRPAWLKKCRGCVFVGKAFLLLVLAALCVKSLNGGQITSEQAAERGAIKAWVSRLPIPAVDHGKVYIVWQGSNGLEFWESYYEVLPRVTNRDCYSLGPPHFNGDIWSCDKDPRQLLEEWKGFDYVLVLKGYADLQRVYPGLIPAGEAGDDRTAFRVEKADGTIRLISLM